MVIKYTRPQNASVSEMLLNGCKQFLTDRSEPNMNNTASILCTFPITENRQRNGGLQFIARYKCFYNGQSWSLNRGFARLDNFGLSDEENVVLHPQTAPLSCKISRMSSYRELQTSRIHIEHAVRLYDISSSTTKLMRNNEKLLGWSIKKQAMCRIIFFSSGIHFSVIHLKINLKIK